MPYALAGSILTTGPRGKSPDILHDWITQVKRSRSVVSDSLWSCGLEPTMLLHLRAFPGKSTGLGFHSLLLDNPEMVSKANQNESVALQWPVIPRPGGGHSKNGAVGEELAGRVPTLLPFERLWGAARATWWRRARAKKAGVRMERPPARRWRHRCPYDRSPLRYFTALKGQNAGCWSNLEKGVTALQGILALHCKIYDEKESGTVCTISEVFYQETWDSVLNVSQP